MTHTVVHIITRLELGGAQLATLFQARHDRFGTAPCYLIYGPGGMLDAEAQRLPGVVCVPAPALARAIRPDQDLAALWQLRGLLRWVRAQHPDRRLLVHTHSSKAGVLGRLAARLAGADTIVHSIHGFGHQASTPTPLRQLLFLSEKAAAQVTDGFTGDSAANLTRGRAEGLITDQRTAVVYCGADLTAFATPRPGVAALRQSLGIPADQVVLLNVSCLKPQKNPTMYLRVAAAIVATHPNVTFLLAGDGALRPSLEALQAQLGVPQARFQLLGWRRDIPELVQLCDVLVLTSLWEGLPQVFAQAMAAAKPIVATRVDGTPEAVTDGTTGHLVAANDVAGMVQALVGLIEDPARRAQFGAAGRARAAAFSQERMVDDLQRFYTTVAGG